MNMPMAKGTAGIGDLRQGRRNARGIGQAIGRRFNLANMAGKQGNTQPVFKFANLLPDGTGGNIQLPGSKRKTIQSYRRLEGMQSFEGRYI
jgi:hypothetical protein